MRFPTIAQITRHPAFETAVWKLRPRESGLLAVGAKRGGPYNISWEIHGNGPIKIMLVGGLGITKADWQRQTYHFGHVRGDRYSVLVVDNLGVGGSDAPFRAWGGYTTSGMARDLLEVADHVGWTAPRSLHVGGGSLGGMIAQEVARRAPARIARLALWSTAPRFVRTGPWSAHLAHAWEFVAPKSFEASLQDTARSCFPEAWLAAPPADDDITTAAVVVEEREEGKGKGKKKSLDHGNTNTNTKSSSSSSRPLPRFDSNYERWAAGEIVKHREGHVTRTGHWMQVLAAARHSLDAEQLRALGDEVGRERILVLHGDQDGMMPVALGRILMAELRPAQQMVVEGLGHAPILERTDWFNGVLEEWFSS